ncbi:MAG: hypothetical protein ACXAC7_12935 [Candidatus Hodarchaeales archaeon]|jgi:hypothetical protein
MVSKFFFSFSSGGAHHISGFGEWQVKIEESSITITLNLHGEIKNYGIFELESNDLNIIKEYLDKCEFNSLKSLTRPGVPDEVIMSFKLKEDKNQFKINKWAKEVQKNQNLAELTEFLKTLIIRFTKKTPVF